MAAHYNRDLINDSSAVLFRDIMRNIRLDEGMVDTFKTIIRPYWVNAYRLVEQRMLRRVCAYAHTRQSLLCLNT